MFANLKHITLKRGHSTNFNVLFTVALMDFCFLPYIKIQSFRDKEAFSRICPHTEMASKTAGRTGSFWPLVPEI